MRLQHSILAVSAVAIGALAIVEAGRLHPSAEAGTASMPDIDAAMKGG